MISRGSVKSLSPGLALKCRSQRASHQLRQAVGSIDVAHGAQAEVGEALSDGAFDEVSRNLCVELPIEDAPEHTAFNALPTIA